MLLNNFFKILSTKNIQDKNIVSVEINKQHQIFLGHFPGNPVVPGVCLIQMIKECIEVLENKKFSIEKADEIKFINMVNPEKTSTLSFEISKKTNHEYQYTYHILVYDGTTIILKMKTNLKEI